MSKTIAINAGSSSLKWQLYGMPEETVIAKGIVERIGLNDSIFTIKYGEGQKFEQIIDIPDHDVAVKMLLDQLIDLGILATYDEITGVGHRVVHGGEFYDRSVVIDDEVLKNIEALADFAPLHNPANAMGIRAFKHLLPNIISVAVFDTAFHATMPEVNYLYSLPREYYETLRVRKYGAHGTSHRYVSERAAEMLGKPLAETKIITCHLGNGASITAVEGGKSVDTSMGFTPLAGVTMGTRSGDIDPSVLPCLMETLDIDINEMINILNNKSWQGKLKNIKKDGTAFTTDAFVIPTLDETGDMTGAISIQRDITKELKKKRELVLALMKEKSDIFIRSKEGNLEQNQVINDLKHQLEKAQIEEMQSLKIIDKYIYSNEKFRLENKNLKTELGLYKKNSDENLAFKFSKENSDLRLENKKTKDKLAQLQMDSEKTISQQRVNYETKIGELSDKINELSEKIETIQTDEVLLQKLEYWKEKAKQETIKIENLEKQIIAHGDKNFMNKIFG